MRNYEFLLTKDRDRLNKIKNAICDRVRKNCVESLSNHELEKICEVIDLNRQYKVVATSDKKQFERDVYCGYTAENDSKGKDLITRYRVFKVLGLFDIGYRRKVDMLYSTKVHTNRCVAYIQEMSMGCDGGFVRNSKTIIYIYIGKSD